MKRIRTKPRSNWLSLAEEYGFDFHTIDGEPYWDESAYYQFTLKQIEQGIEDPTEEIHQMCLEVVDKVTQSEALMEKFRIPEAQRDAVIASWKKREPSLYSRLDFCYDGTGFAKLYENNADTPTSLYETGFWQWLWLEDKLQDKSIPANADQFNILQDYLVEHFRHLAQGHPEQPLYFSSCKGSLEDRGTVQYLQDCAQEAGIDQRFVYIEDIGINTRAKFTDLDDTEINWMFKLYPWEFMFEEEYADYLGDPGMHWLEPMWKSILSNKALLPMLWQLFPRHPNLLESYFSDDPKRTNLNDYVVKPLFSREGANVSIYQGNQLACEVDGPYGDEGVIYQAYQPLPNFDDNFTLIGSWLVNDKAAGISIREDMTLITEDTSRYLPHIIID